MKKVVFLLFLLMNGIMVTPLCAQRVRVCFDEGWQFHLGDIALKQAVKAGQQGGLTDTGAPRAEGEETMIAYTDRNKTIPYKAADWTDVDIPHDWLVDIAPEEDYTIGSQGAGNGFHRPGIGCYRKEFSLDEQCRGKRLTLEFDGIFRASTVWVNGHLMGHHESGYTPSFYDISEVARYGSEGENVVFVKVDATEYEGWWYEGCGIYRHTWLTITEELHVARFGTFITTPDVSQEKARVNVETTIENESDRLRRFKVINTITDNHGTLLQKMETTCEAKGGAKVVISQDAIVEKPKLWSPETPELYQMHTSLVEDNKTVDNLVTAFGIRSVEMRGDGFYLNGKRYPVKGTANHQDHAGVGVALPDGLQSYRIKLLKEMGSNGYRTAHHPPTPELLDVCDSLGMLVLDENRHLWASEAGMNDLRTLILRDRNHPCVFMWSLENEENLEGTEMGARLLKKLSDEAHRLDPTRQTTAAMNHGWNEGGYSDQVDVVGYNYGQRGLQYVKDHEQYPDRLMLATESTSYVATRGEYKDDWEKGYMSNFGKGVSWGLQPGEDWQHPDGAYLHAMHPARWGDFHYRIKGIKDDGQPILEGGWQNNRPAEPSADLRMVENVKEELDAPGEWYYDNGWLYYMPLPEDELMSAHIEVSRLPELIRIVGTNGKTATNVNIEGLCFTMSERTFMQPYEPLLRSDWTIYRGGAVVLENTANCGLSDCDLYNLGGNAVFLSGRNDKSYVRGSHIHHIGASGLCVVGMPSAVRSPSFNYYQYVNLADMDFKPGPASDDYPKNCVLEDNLIHHIGMYEKQVAGVELSMAMDINVSHNTIYHTPRAAVNIGDGTWGGHVIAHNDLFDTVLETGDHGSINAWGRDRYWHSTRSTMDSIVMRPYEPVNISQWGRKVDNNIFTDSLSLQTSREKYGQDTHSCMIPLHFTAPQLGDYSISKSHPLTQTRFQVFAMTDFGVQSDRLKAIAAWPSYSIPVAVSVAEGRSDSYREWQGLRVQNVDNEGLMSATGMYAMTGVYVMAVVNQYAMLSRHISAGDVIIAVNGREVKASADLADTEVPKTLTVLRNQKKKEINLELKNNE